MDAINNLGFGIGDLIIYRGPEKSISYEYEIKYLYDGDWFIVCSMHGMVIEILSRFGFGKIVLYSEEIFASDYSKIS